MGKTIKPGQIYVHNGSFLRAKKRTDGCNGCILKNFILCPDISTNVEKRPNCIENNIIFTKF